MKCGKCGHEIVDGSKFCENCGNPVESGVASESINKCPNCGEAVDTESKFCENCGNMLNNGGDAPKEQEEETVQQQEVVQETPVQNSEPMSFGSSQPVSGFAEHNGGAQQQVSFDGGTAQTPKKKANTGLIAGIVVLVLLLIGGGVGAGLFLKSRGGKIDGAWELERIKGDEIIEVKTIPADEMEKYKDNIFLISFNKDGSCDLGFPDPEKGYVTFGGEWKNDDSDKNAKKITVSNARGDNLPRSFEAVLKESDKLEIKINGVAFTYKRISDSDIDDMRGFLMSRTTEKTTTVQTTQETTQATTQQAPAVYIFTQQNQQVAPMSISELEFLVLQGNQRYYTDADLVGRSKYELMILRNGLFALSGRKFVKNQQVMDFFNGCSWYYPDTTSDDVAKSRFNEYQRANLEKIKLYE